MARRRRRCPKCGKQSDKRYRGCRKCYLPKPWTPLRKWHKRSGQTWEWLAAEAGVCRRTVLRVAQGHRCNRANAEAIGEATGIPTGVLRRGVER